jgi:hypothetical protein
MMFSQLAVISTYSAVVPGERVIVAIPKSSVWAVESERLTWVEFVVNVTTALTTGFPSKSIVTVISAVSAVLAVIIVGVTCIKTSPVAIVTVVDSDRPCQVTFTVATPEVRLGVRITVASPAELVVLVGEERVPLSVAKATWVLSTGSPSRSNTAVIVVVMVESAAMVEGLAESDRVPAATTTDTVWVMVPHSAVTNVVPVAVSGVKVTVAYP